MVNIIVYPKNDFPVLKQQPTLEETQEVVLDDAKTYADGLVVGLLDDRGDYDASGNTFPASGGSGTAGAIKKGDMWRISVAGTLGGVHVSVDAWIRALTDAPGQTASNWAIAEGGKNKYGVTASLSSSSGVVTIDCAADTDVYDLTLTENVTSWSFTNLPAAGTYRDVQVRITQHASAAKTVVSPATSGRTAGGAWVQSTIVSSIELLTIRVFSDGTKHLFPSGVFA